jgi:hypothetical protein
MISCTINESFQMIMRKISKSKTKILILILRSNENLNGDSKNGHEIKLASTTPMTEDEVIN